MKAHAMLALLACTIGACSGRFGAQEKPQPDAGSWLDRSPRALACKELATSTCAQIESCAPFLATTGTSFGALCIESFVEPCLRSAGLGGSMRTPADLSACAATTRSLSCADFVARHPDVCEIPPGTGADGSRCAFDEQCKSRFCARPSDTACGTCSPSPAIGGPCVDGACGHGMVCAITTTCARLAALGEPCAPDRPCNRAGFCEIDRCVPRKKPDERCTGFGTCDPFAETACSADSLCRATKLAKLGEACSLTANALTLCEAPARCIGDRCSAARRDGEPCGTEGGHACEGLGGECIRGKCVHKRVETCP